MRKVATAKSPVNSNSPLQLKVQKSGPLQAQIIIEQSKEYARLQKAFAKMQVKKDSEIAKLKAELSQAKKGIRPGITKIELVALN